VDPYVRQPDDRASKQWAAFLDHPMVRVWHTGDQRAAVSVVTYLCRKAIHELRVGCWIYQQVPRIWELMNTSPEPDPADTQALQIFLASSFHAWYDKWRPLADSWEGQFAVLEEQYGHIGAAHDLTHPLDGPGEIARIAAIIDTIAVMMTEVRALPKPVNTRVGEFVDWMLAGAEIIYDLYSAMRNHDYVYIWLYPRCKESVC
jgi:hypothetical protein